MNKKQKKLLKEIIINILGGLAVTVIYSFIFVYAILQYCAV